MEKNVESKNKSWGVTGFVCSILGIMFFVLPYFGLPLAILGVVGYYNQNKIEPTGLAMAGNVIGIIGIVINSIILLLMLIGAIILIGAM